MRTDQHPVRILTVTAMLLAQIVRSSCAFIAGSRIAHVSGPIVADRRAKAPESRASASARQLTPTSQRTMPTSQNLAGKISSSGRPNAL